LHAHIAERLGQRAGGEPNRLAAWRALERALRLASLQGFQVVLAIDGCDEQVDQMTRRDIESLAQVGTLTSAELTMIQIETIEQDASPARWPRWSEVIVLDRLTRSQAERYLAAKLARVGAVGQIFTSRAVTRLHALSSGVPRALEQLASRCLVAGANRNLEAVHSDLVEAIVAADGMDAVGTNALCVPG
jgi:hypothetical protein